MNLLPQHFLVLQVGPDLFAVQGSELLEIVVNEFLPVLTTKLLSAKCEKS
jgi:hypothetical protein